VTPIGLISRIRKDGGRIWLDRQGCLRAKGVSEERLRRLRESPYLITAVLREEIASKRWEQSGKDPNWWRHPEELWSYSEQSLKPVSEIVRIWVGEQCAVRNVSSDAHILHREFSAWAGFEPDAAAEREFLLKLVASGFPLDEGMVRGICLAVDFKAPLKDEDDREHEPGRGTAVNQRSRAVPMTEFRESTKRLVTSCTVEEIA
jgi:hypothetical protein